MLLLATACTGAADDDDADPDATPTASVTPTPSETAATSSPSDNGAASEDDGASDGETASPDPSAATVDLPAIDRQCSIEPDLPEVERVRYAVPSSWIVEDDRCDVLDPGLDELPDQTEVDAAVFVDIAPVGYGEVTGPSPALRDVSTWVGARANLQSSRRTAVSTGEALTPEGQRSIAWRFDLDAGTDAQGGVLTISGGPSDAASYQQAAAVVDSIAQTVVIEPPAEGPSTSPGEGGSAIVRVEGGGTPYSVTYDGDCFRLRPGGPTDDATDELCDLEPTDQLTAGVLGDGVVVGYASPLAVRVDTPGLDTPGAIATAIESSSVYAVDVGAEQQPAELVAVDATGRELARTEAG